MARLTDAETRGAQLLWMALAHVEDDPRTIPSEEVVHQWINDVMADPERLLPDPAFAADVLAAIEKAWQQTGCLECSDAHLSVIALLDMLAAVSGRVLVRSDGPGGGVMVDETYTIRESQDGQWEVVELGVVGSSAAEAYELVKAAAPLPPHCVTIDWRTATDEGQEEAMAAVLTRAGS